MLTSSGLTNLHYFDDPAGLRRHGSLRPANRPACHASAARLQFQWMIRPFSRPVCYPTPRHRRNDAAAETRWPKSWNGRLRAVCPGTSALLRHEGCTHERLRRTRNGPLHDDGSTTRPPWVISTSPEATKRRAPLRAGSIRLRHPSGSTDLAASLGQMVAPRALASRSDRMDTSNATSTGRTFRLRQRAEQ